MMYQGRKVTREELLTVGKNVAEMLAKEIIVSSDDKPETCDKIIRDLTSLGFTLEEIAERILRYAK